MKTYMHCQICHTELKVKPSRYVDCNKCKTYYFLNDSAEPYGINFLLDLGEEKYVMCYFLDSKILEICKEDGVTVLETTYSSIPKFESLKDKLKTYLTFS